jgi:hypothetical protein
MVLQEAWEEAGLVGVLQKEPVGSYLYEKYGNTYHVTVFIMHVTGAAARWPEVSVRRRSWLRPAKARLRIDQPGLRKLMRQLLTDETVTIPA